MSLLQMSLCGAAMVFAIAAARALTLHKLPKKVFPLLWGIALARLLLPYSLPCSLSVYSLLARLCPAAGPAGMVPAVSAVSGGAVQSAAGTAPTSPSIPAPRGDLSFGPWETLWLAGALACTVFFTVAYFKCRREFQTSLPVENRYVRLWLCGHRLCRPIAVRQSDRISAPLTYGVLRPVILLPKTAGWDDGDALEYALDHEYIHIRRFDAAFKLALTAALCIHWFNPAVWAMYILANRDVELSCDEAVIQISGGEKSAYARALIHMEERRSSFAPFCSGFGKNAIEERIVAIMKMKKASVPALLAATGLIAGIAAAFATSAAEPPEDQGQGPAFTAADTLVMMSYTGPEDGKTYYSTDGGKTFVPMTAGEFAAAYPAPEVEWWTYDEYRAWLENEKEELQSMLGEKGWTGGRGEFIWTQEIIDETIAMYEEILENIQKGCLVSKTVDGSEDTMLMMGSEKGPASISSLSYAEYEPFGITINKRENALYYNGEKIRRFEDSADMGGGAVASRCSYYCEDGTVSLRAVRAPEQNPDGSTNPFGPILRLEALTPEEEKQLIENDSLAGLTAEAYSSEIADEAENTEELLKAYEPFGLTFRTDLFTGALRMDWQGKPVHSLYDPKTGVWAANSMRGIYLGPDAVDLEAVYEDGKLSGLKQVPHIHSMEATAAAESGTGEGIPLPDMFEKYSPYGITYREVETADGMERNLYYNGALINGFYDLDPEGGVFSFASSRQSKDGLKIRTVYEGGKLAGVRISED